MVRATPPVLVVSHPECAGHVPILGHPERPERLAAALDGAMIDGAVAREATAGEDAAIEAVRRVHDVALVERVRSAAGRGRGLVDSPDCPVSSGSFRAAWRAAAAAADAAAAVAEGEARTVWLAVRPPGHHARRDRAMGFCLFNNVAIAAEQLLARGVGPLAIVDFDVHHGNGTQEHFYDRPDVYFFSVHQYPFYPGSGGADETGSGRGRGFTRNLPLAAGADDATYSDAVALGLEEAERTAAPAAWLVSAGFDAHRDDPLGGMCLSAAGFGRIGALIGEAASGRPVIATLEGGYDLKALRESVRAFVQGLARNVAP